MNNPFDKLRADQLARWFLGVSLSVVLLLSSVPALAIGPTDAHSTSSLRLRSGQAGQASGELPPAADSQGEQPAETYQVTLITGDTVIVTKTSDGKKAIAISPADPGKLGQRFLTEEQNGAIYVFPDGIDLNKLDKELFNIDYLIGEGYDKLPNLPLLVSYISGLSDARVQSLEAKVEALG